MNTKVYQVTRIVSDYLWIDWVDSIPTIFGYYYGTSNAITDIKKENKGRKIIAQLDDYITFSGKKNQEICYKIKELEIK